MNTFGKILRLSTFGESHGRAIGGVLDGLPAGLKIDLAYIKAQMAMRKPGGKYATNRKEDDDLSILSGVFEDNGALISTGTPIGFIIKNTAQHSGDYDNIKDIFRPGHADYTYLAKYGVRDYKGGGRASARETAIRVGGGAFAGLLLDEFGIKVQAGVISIGKIGQAKHALSALASGKNSQDCDFSHAENSEIFALNPSLENEQKELIQKLKNEGKSVGASVIVRISGLFAGLGEPLYYKLDSQLSAAMMGINGAKAVELGIGAHSAKLNGFENNDFIQSLKSSKQNTANFNQANALNIGKNALGYGLDYAPSARLLSNNAGGVLGGLSNGADIFMLIHFKPTPSIFEDEPCINTAGDDDICALRGRHDPCIGVRGAVVACAMARLVLADMLLLGASKSLAQLKKAWR